MEKHQTIKENMEDTANALNQKTNQDFNGKRPSTSDADLKEEAPDTETPGIGDEQKKYSGEIIMEDEERNDTDEYKTETPLEEEPVNQKAEQNVADDSDTPSKAKKDVGNVF